MIWILLWIYWSPITNLETYARHVSADDRTFDTQEQCVQAMTQRQATNDFQFMVDNLDDRFICVGVPGTEKEGK